MYIVKEVYTFKTAKRPPVQKKERRRDNKENSARKRSVEFRRANNAPVALSLTSTVGLC
jgi:hypothetical protein